MIVHLLTTALLQFVWQGALAAASLWVALVVLRSRSANARYVVSGATLAVLAAAPFVSAALAYRRPMPAHQAPAIAAAVAREAVLRVAALPSTDWMALAQAWILPLWACGVFIFSLRLLWSYREVSALRRSGAPAEDSVIETVSRLAAKLGVERPVHVMLSPLAGSPSVVGWMRPVILLPVGTLFGLTPEQLEAVIAHELAHIRRYDYLVNVVQMLVETLFFYHPAVWWISRRIRIERELCCDDIAVASCGDAVSYARALTMLERIRLHPSFAVGADDGPLMYRVQRLLGVAPREFAPSRISALAAIAIAVVCFGINLRLAHAQTPPPPVHDQPGITVDLHGANVTERQAVTYPPAARNKGSQGNVVVEVTLDEKGNVSDAKVLGGPQGFRKTVLQSVLSWHFAAADAGTTKQVSVDFQKPRQVQSTSNLLVAPDKPPLECTAELERQGYGVDYGVKLSCANSDGGVFFFRSAPRGGIASTPSGPASNDRLEDYLSASRPTDRFSQAITNGDAFIPGVVYIARQTTEGYFTMLTEDQLKAQIEKEQTHAAALREQQTTASPQGAEQLQGAILKSEENLRKMRLDLTIGRRYIGRTLDAIGTTGFTDAQRAQLLERLPLQVGEPVSRQEVFRAINAAHEFDLRARSALEVTPDGKLAFNVVLQ
jgi:TonB family protein